MLYQKDGNILTERALRAELPDVSLPEDLLPEVVAEFGFVPYVESAAAPLTAEQLAAQLQTTVVARTQQRLDDFARTRNYDSILSLCTYATSPTPRFAAEGQYGVTVRDTTWATLYEILGEIQAGARPMPAGYADIEPDLPPLMWPL